MFNKGDKVKYSEEFVKKEGNDVFYSSNQKINTVKEVRVPKTKIEKDGFQPMNLQETVMVIIFEEGGWEHSNILELVK